MCWNECARFDRIDCEITICSNGDDIRVAEEDFNIAELHRNIEVMDVDGSTKSLMESTFIWMLKESSGKLSTGRLKRVQGSKSPDHKRIELSYSNTGLSLFESDQLQIGEWALLKHNNDDIQKMSGNPEQHFLNGYPIGYVTGFRIVDKKGQ